MMDSSDHVVTDKKVCPKCACPRSKLENCPPTPGTHPYLQCEECEYIWTEAMWQPPQRSIVALREWADHCGEEYDGEPTPYKCGIQAAKRTVLAMLTRRYYDTVTMGEKSDK